MKSKLYLIIIGLLFFMNSNSQFVGIISGGVGEESQLLTDLFAYYPLDESSGNFIDTHGNRDLTASGTLTYSVGGKVGTCVTFTTDGQGKHTPDDWEFTGDYSVSCWIKTDAVGTQRGIVTYYGGTGRGWHALQQNSGGVGAGQALSKQWWSGGSHVTTAYVQIINDDAWYHLVETYSASSDDLKIYINGILRGNADNGNATIGYETDCDFEIGSNDDSGFFDGEIDEVAVWKDRELSVADVGYLYNSGSGIAYPLDY